MILASDALRRIAIVSDRDTTEEGLIIDLEHSAGSMTAGIALLQIPNFSKSHYVE